jgi:hypothetical protein
VSARRGETVVVRAEQPPTTPGKPAPPLVALPEVRCTLLDRGPGTSWWAMPAGERTAITVRHLSRSDQWVKCTP